MTRLTLTSCLLGGFSFGLLVCSSLAEQGKDAPSAKSTLAQQLQQAAEATGEAYLEAKSRLLKEIPLDVIRGKDSDESLTWAQRQAAHAAIDQGTNAQAYELAVRRLAGFLDEKRVLPRVLPDTTAQLWVANPLDIPADSEPRKFFEGLSQQRGLVYEVLFKHTRGTISSLAAAAKAEQHDEGAQKVKPPERDDKREELFTRHGPGLPRFDAQAWLTSLTERDQAELLNQAHDR